MLIISGTAERKAPSEEYNVGSTHSVMIFSTDEVLENNLKAIEEQLNALGWDEIVIEDAEIVADVNDLTHTVLQDGYNKALSQGLAFVVTLSTVDEANAA